MSLSYAILGLLSHSPKTGYELKKIMQSSPFMYWAASNNQIYNTLTELKAEAYVTNETLLQENSPAKKLYTITQDGLEALKKWTLSKPEAPEFRKGFLIQLAWSEQLSNKQLGALLDSYENEIKARIALESEIIKGELYSPSRSEREKVIWKCIFESGVTSLENELSWICELREKLKNTDCSAYERMDNENNAIERRIEMFNYKTVSGYIEVLPDGRVIGSERDASNLISLCVENGLCAVLVHDMALSDDFLRLKTGIAGAILQKFTNYNIKLAIVVDKNRMSTRFKELANELNSGKAFGVFDSAQAAEKWLAGGKSNESL